MCDEIIPGAEPSYQICKEIYLYHPLGAKMAEAPIVMAQSQARDIAIPKSPEDRVRKAFTEEWTKIGADDYIKNTYRLARVYGIASIGLLSADTPSDQPINYEKLADEVIAFNVFDPLNTAGSLVLNQNANAIDFLKTSSISVQGQAYHRSRTCIVLNEEPIFLGYTSSAFGYVGRSVYQRALFPLKSFINTMVADDMLARKVGVLVAKMQQPGSIADRAMQILMGRKRQLLKEAETNNVIGISTEEDIETLNMQHADGALAISRKDILENIAVAADMPAKMLNSETFAEGFGEGTEDAKNVARYVDGIRKNMRPIYEFFDKIVQYRAWNEEFYKIIQKEYPEQYGKMPYKQAFFEWTNSFTAAWPSLLKEPESEEIKVEDVKLKAIIAMIEVLGPMLDPVNKGVAIQWACDNFNDIKMLFSSPLTLDFDELTTFLESQPTAAELAEKEPSEPKPFAAQDSEKPARKAYNEAVATFITLADAKKRRQLERRNGQA